MLAAGDKPLSRILEWQDCTIVLITCCGNFVGKGFNNNPRHKHSTPTTIWPFHKGVKCMRCVLLLVVVVVLMAQADLLPAAC